MCLRLWFSVVSAAVFSHVVGAGDAFSHWPLDLRIGGRVVVAPQAIDGPTLKSAVSRVASESRVTVLFDRGVKESDWLAYAGAFSAAQHYHARRVEGWRDPRTVAAALVDSDVVVIGSTQGLAPNDRPAWVSVREAFRRFLARGGELLFTGPMGELVATHSIRGGSQQSLSAGLGLIPDSLIRFGELPTDREGVRDRLHELHDFVGITVSENAILVLNGRIVSVVGPGSVSVLLPDADDGGEPVKTIKARRRSRQSGNDYLIDWTQWRRRSRDRGLPKFPAEQPEPPFVEEGALVIVGGGGTPAGMMKRFVDLAGGPEEARLVYVPCSERTKIEGRPSILRLWEKMGVRQTTFIHTKDRRRADEDESILTPLREATGIWFGGGRQWNFADSYYGTESQRLMQEVVRRGGVVGGSSAGASIQAKFLARATPIENFNILAPGYERGGLGFLSGVAIDQHFSQRKRQPDMERLVARYPQLLGIGIDESTALLVRGKTAEVFGKGDVYFYDHRVRESFPLSDNENEGAAPYPNVLASGGIYDLQSRRVIRDSNSETETEDVGRKGSKAATRRR